MQEVQEIRSFGRLHGRTESQLVTTQCCMHITQSYSEGHHRVADELELILKRSVLWQSVGRIAGGGVLAVVGGVGAVGVAALEVVLPEL